MTAPQTSSNTGPGIPNPPNVGVIEVNGGQSETLTDVIADSIKVNAGGSLVATRVRVMGGCVILPQDGGALTKAHFIDCAMHSGMFVGIIDAGGNLSWANAVPVDMLISGSWLYQPQGQPPDHTEALAGFGWPQGVRFENSSFIQQGPNNNTATATINWHGVDSVFDGCYFGWEPEGDPATFFTVYIEGVNNVCQNSQMEKGSGDYVYPDSSPQATYTSVVDAFTGELIPQSGGSPPPPPEPEEMPMPVIDFSVYSIDPDVQAAMTDLQATVKTFVDGLETQVAGFTDQSTAVTDLQSKVAGAGNALMGS